MFIFVYLLLTAFVLTAFVLTTFILTAFVLTAFIIFIFFTAGFILRMGLVGGGLQNTSEQDFISLYVFISWHT